MDPGPDPAGTAPLPRRDSVAMLGAGLPESGPADAAGTLEALAAELGDFPSALRLLAAYLRRLAEWRGQPELTLARLREIAAGEREAVWPDPPATLWTGAPAAISYESAAEADVLTVLGLFLHRNGDLDGAEAAFATALRIDACVLGAEHPNVARDENNRGLLRRDRSELDPARACHERALAIGEAAFGPDHPLVARYVNNLGIVLLDQGDALGALQAFRRAFAIDERAYGPDHTSVAIRASNLGNALRLFAEFEEARGAYELAHDIFLRKLGPEHINTKAVAANIASLGGLGWF